MSCISKKVLLFASGILGVCFSFAVSGESTVTVVKDNSPKAAIIVPEKTIDVEKLAAAELQHHIMKATGVKLPVYNEKEQSADFKNFIYIGNCKKTADEGIKTSELEPSGYIIRTIDGNLFLTGKDRMRSANEYPFNVGNQWSVGWQGTLFAVYDLLENEMGVRWLWPGELGEIVPPAKDISFNNIDRKGKPSFISARYTIPYKIPKDSLGWASEENKIKFLRDQHIFLLRHRFGSVENMYYGHNFQNYWERFGKSNPEFFNLLPNGKRGPLEGDAMGHDISMCVSEPGLWKQMIADWEKSPERNPENIPCRPFINACENDSPGMCMCEKCRTWDASGPEFENSDYWGKKIQMPRKLRFTIARAAWGEDVDVKKEVASLSDRYGRFYKEVLDAAKKTHPDAVVAGYAYANYWKAPKNAKLDKDIVILYVPPLWFPYTDEMSKSFRENWDGWRKTGVEKMILRPNLTHAGANLPIFYARQIAGDFSYAAAKGMIGTAFDSLLGAWSAQGPTLYTLTRIHEHPDWTADKILDEYYSGFGKAKNAVKKYFDYWEKYSNSLDEKTIRKYCTEERDGTGRPGGGFKNYVRIAHRIFPPEVFSGARKLMNEAIANAKGDILAEKRVSFLEKGLTDAELTAATRAAQSKYEKEETEENKKVFEVAFKKLVDYRGSVEADNVCNFGHTAYREMSGSGWKHTKATDNKK